MVKIRLNRIGAKGRPFYRIVVAPSTSARGGTFVEQVGTYDPLKDPAEVRFDRERTLRWLSQGAKPSEPVLRLLRLEGLLQEFEAALPKAKPRRKPKKPRVKEVKVERPKKQRQQTNPNAAFAEVADSAAAGELPPQDESSEGQG